MWTWNDMKRGQRGLADRQSLLGRQHRATYCEAITKLSLRFSGLHEDERCCLEESAMRRRESTSASNQPLVVLSIRAGITLFCDMITRLSAKTRKWWAVNPFSKFWMPRKQVAAPAIERTGETRTWSYYFGFTSAITRSRGFLLRSPKWSQWVPSDADLRGLFNSAAFNPNGESFRFKSSLKPFEIVWNIRTADQPRRWSYSTCGLLYGDLHWRDLLHFGDHWKF